MSKRTDRLAALMRKSKSALNQPHSNTTFLNEYKAMQEDEAKLKSKERLLRDHPYLSEVEVDWLIQKASKCPNCFANLPITAEKAFQHAYGTYGCFSCRGFRICVVDPEGRIKSETFFDLQSRTDHKIEECIEMLSRWVKKTKGYTIVAIDPKRIVYYAVEL